MLYRGCVGTLTRVRSDERTHRFLHLLLVIAIVLAPTSVLGAVESVAAPRAAAAGVQYHFVNLGTSQVDAISPNGQYIVAPGELLNAGGSVVSFFPGNFVDAGSNAVNNAGTVGGGIEPGLDGAIIGPGAYLTLGSGTATQLPTPADTNDPAGVWLTGAALPNNNTTPSFAGTGDCGPGQNSNANKGAVLCSAGEAYYYLAGASSPIAIPPVAANTFGNVNSFGMAINDGNVVVGVTTVKSGGGGQDFYSTAGGAPTLMGPVAGPSTATAEPSAINDAGLVVGHQLLVSGGGDDAWSAQFGASSYTDLGALPAPPLVNQSGFSCGGGAISDAYAVNASGVIVGQSLTSDSQNDPQGFQQCGIYHAVVWSKGATTPIDLNATGETDAPAGWVLTNATGVDAAGDIVGDAVSPTGANTGVELQSFGVSSVSPTFGPADGSNPVTVNGSGFTGATSLHLVPVGGGTAISVPFTVVNNTQITFTAPNEVAAVRQAGSSVSYDVQITNSGGSTSATTATDQYTFNFPKVSSVSPSSGPVAGLGSMTISGSGFTGATSLNLLVKGNAVEVVPLSGPGITVTDTSITFATAPNLTIAVNAIGNNTDTTVDIQVSIPAGGGALVSKTSSADLYTARVPVVTGVYNGTFPGTSAGSGNVPAGPASGGEQVTVLGSGFTGVTGVDFSVPGSTSADATSVFCGNGATSCSVLSDSKIQFTAPDATSLLTASGNPNGNLLVDTIVSIPVSNNNLQLVTSSPAGAGANDTFTLVPLAITHLSLTQGPAVGGDTVTVTGTGLAHATILLDGGASTLSSGTSIDSVTPNSGATDTSLAYTVPDETAALQHNSGLPVTVDVEAQVTVAAGGGTLTLTTPKEAADKYIIEAPFVNQVKVLSGGSTPNSSGPIAGGTVIQVSGGNLTGTTEVLFSDAGAVKTSQVIAPNPVVSSDGTSLTVTTPNASKYGPGNAVTDVEALIPIKGSNPAEFLNSPQNSPSDNFTFVGAPDAAPSCNTLQNCQGSSNTSPSGSAVATSTDAGGSITATGTGAGGITVGRYASNPVGVSTFKASGSFFDVRASNPNGFTSVTIADCDLGTTTSVQWWNPAANGGTGGWQPVSNQTLSAGPPACDTITINANTSPQLAQLNGTVFGGSVQNVLPLVPASLQAGTVDTTYSAAISLSNGVQPVTYTASVNPPVPGLSLGATSGVLSGVPTRAGPFPFTLAAVDSQGSVGSQAYTLTVQRAPTALRLTVPGSVAPNAPVQVSASFTNPIAPTAPTGTVVFTLTTTSGGTTVQSGAVSGGQAQVTFAAQPGAPTFTVTASYQGDANFLPTTSGTLGTEGPQSCMVNGSVQQAGVGSLSFLRLQVPNSSGQVAGAVNGALIVSHPAITACSTAGIVHTANVTGVAAGSSATFPPGTTLTLQLVTNADGSASVSITGSNTRTATLQGAATTASGRLTISAL